MVKQLKHIHIMNVLGQILGIKYKQWMINKAKN